MYVCVCVCVCVCWEVLGLVSTEAGAVSQMRDLCLPTATSGTYLQGHAGQTELPGRSSSFTHLKEVVAAAVVAWWSEEVRS